MEKYEFNAVIQQPADGKPGAYVLFPYDPLTCFGKKNQIPVECTFDGIPYRGSIVNMGAGPCIGVLKVIREQLGKGHGDRIHVEVWQDTTERVIDIPPDLAQGLKDNPTADHAWEKLSYSHRREYAEYILSAKKEETRQSRVIKTLERLSNIKKG